MGPIAANQCVVGRSARASKDRSSLELVKVPQGAVGFGFNQARTGTASRRDRIVPAHAINHITTVYRCQALDCYDKLNIFYLYVITQQRLLRWPFDYVSR